ncbi:methylmalonyl-CoA epimerase [Candidatus Micrarchaeota archaeon]|nr:MAG: methylmalonyl-CoA epimerase [Candidatus Micrarchaeota archaeon]
MIKRVDHIAVAVPNVEEAARFYEEALGLKLGGVEVVEGMDTKVGFFQIGETRIELVEPTKEDTALDKFLASRGPGIHHICFEVEDIEAALRTLKERGVRLVDEEPRPGAHGTRVGFIHPKSTGGVLIELSQHPRGSH